MTRPTRFISNLRGTHVLPPNVTSRLEEKPNKAETITDEDQHGICRYLPATARSFAPKVQKHSIRTSYSCTQNGRILKGTFPEWRYGGKDLVAARTQRLNGENLLSRASFVFSKSFRLETQHLLLREKRQISELCRGKCVYMRVSWVYGDIVCGNDYKAPHTSSRAAGGGVVFFCYRRCTIEATHGEFVASPGVVRAP